MARDVANECPLWVKSRHDVSKSRCPLYSQKRTFGSARHVRFVPLAEGAPPSRSGDVNAIAGPKPASMAALLGYKAEAIPLGLEDPLFIVEGFVDECREHRSISRIHAFSFGPADFATQREISEPRFQY